jgi:hypothetical protein
MARVDVVIPTRNRVDLCLEAARSVQAQTMQDWRLFVVDDGSDDPAVPDALERALRDDPRVSVLRRPVAGRAPAARHDGYLAGSSPWVAILDSDDVWLPTKLQRQLDVSAGRDLVLAWFAWVRPDGSVRVVRRPEGEGRVSPLLTNNMSMPLISRSLLDRNGGFLAPGGGSWMTADNIELFLRLLPRANVATAREVLVQCRDHPGQRASDLTNSAQGAAELTALLEIHDATLAPWPAARAELHCRAALRWAIAQDRGLAKRHLRHSLSAAPSLGQKLRLGRTFLPTYVRSAGGALRGAA